MKKEYVEIITERLSLKKETNDIFKKLKRHNKKKLDDVFHKEHSSTFDEVDCLKCANCCKTTSPIFRDTDIKKLSKRFRQKTHDFINDHLKLDADGDYILRSVPCPFLWDDNTCSVYEDRPLACKEYPHTNRKNMYQVLDLTQKNLEICPAVCKIINTIETKFETKIKKYR